MHKHSRIGVLMGGLSSEKSVSLETGEAVLHALLERGYDALPIYVDRDLDLAIRQAGIDAAFIALHGRYGEDGCVQGLLETLGIAYTGSGVLASALAMNKVKAKEIFRLHNLPTPSYYVMSIDDEADILSCHGDFGFPVVVKPVNEGSSVGVAIVDTPEELVDACERAFCFDDQVLVERHVEGMEISVGIVGDAAMGAVEIEPASDFYDYGAKYTARTTRYHVPPRVSQERYLGVLRQALRAHRALGCSGASRVDMIVSATGNEYVLEVNSLPGLTPQSLLPKIAHAAGLEFEDLVEVILDDALCANQRRGRGRTAAAVALPGDRDASGVALADRH
jgi:D-alanine-D-alanine ligase